jgi:hypothetical protein
VHVVPAPRHVPGHPACVVTAHPIVPLAGSDAQHAPVGGGVTAHVVFVQVDPTPSHLPCRAAHPDSVVTVHVAAPVGLLSTQHAPLFVPVCASAPWATIIRPAQHSAAAPRRIPASDKSFMETSSVSLRLITGSMSARHALAHQARRDKPSERQDTSKCCPRSTSLAMKSHNFARPTLRGSSTSESFFNLTRSFPDHVTPVCHEHPPTNHAFRKLVTDACEGDPAPFPS